MSELITAKNIMRAVKESPKLIDQLSRVQSTDEIRQVINVLSGDNTDVIKAHLSALKKIETPNTSYFEDLIVDDISRRIIDMAPRCSTPEDGNISLFIGNEVQHFNILNFNINEVSMLSSNSERCCIEFKDKREVDMRFKNLYECLQWMIYAKRKGFDLIQKMVDSYNSINVCVEEVIPKASEISITLRQAGVLRDIAIEESSLHVHDDGKRTVTLSEELEFTK